MKRYALVLLLTFLIACSTDKLNQNYTVPQNNDINNIIKATIYQNQLPVLKYRQVIDTFYDENGKRRIFTRKSVPLYIHLVKFTVIHLTKVFPTNGLPPPPPAPNTLILERLLSVKIDGKYFFSKSDSSYLFFLNDVLKKFKISDKTLKNILITNNVEKLNERIFDEKKSFYTISIPILSQDNKKAYVIVGYHCYGLCGYGTGVYLKKLNGKWRVLKTQQLWVS